MDSILRLLSLDGIHPALAALVIAFYATFLVWLVFGVVAARVRRRIGATNLDGMPIPYDGGINKDIIPPDMIDEPWNYVDGFANIGELPNLIAGFKRRGWNDADLGKVLGGNWLRVYRQVWGA